MGNIKAKQVRVYLQPDEVQALDDLCKASGLKETVILTILCASALRAIKKSGNKINIPLNFKLTEEAN